MFGSAGIANPSVHVENVKMRYNMGESILKITKLDRAWCYVCQALKTIETIFIKDGEEIYRVERCRGCGEDLSRWEVGT